MLLILIDLLSTVPFFRIAFVSLIFTTTILAQSYYIYPIDLSLSCRSRGAFVDGSPLVNPSYASRERFGSVQAMISSFQADSVMYEFSGTVPLSMWHTAGAGWIVYSRKHSGISGYFQPGTDTTDRTRSIFVNYSFDPWNIVSVGTNIDMAFEKRPGRNWKSGLGIDFGFSLPVMHSAAYGNHRIGLTLNNILESGFDFYGNYSKDCGLSLSSGFLDEKLSFHVNCIRTDVFNRTETGAWRTDLKLSGEVLPQTHLSINTGFNPSSCEYLCATVLIDLPVLGHDRNLSMGYAFLKQLGSVPFAQTVYAKTEFGRERIDFKKLHADAISLYNEGKWAEAYFALGNVAAVFPYCQQSADIRFSMGDCAEHMYLPRFAMYEYSAVIGQYSQNEAAARCRQRGIAIACRNGDTVQARRDYESLVSAGKDSLARCADYSIGEFFCRQNEMDSAFAHFNLIPPQHPFFPFAQYSCAIASYNMGRKDSAADYFEKCALYQAGDNQQELISDMACLMLSCIYYEQNTPGDSGLAKSISALSAVPRYSACYPYALLIRCWIACKAGKWSDCITYSDELIRVGTRKAHPSLPEAFLLSGYGRLMVRDFEGALEVLEKKYHETILPIPLDSSILDGNSTVDALSTMVERNDSEIRTIAFSKGRQRSEQKAAELIRLLVMYDNAVENHRLLVDQYEFRKKFLLPRKEVDENIRYVIAKAAMFRNRKK